MMRVLTIVALILAVLALVLVLIARPASAAITDSSLLAAIRAARGDAIPTNAVLTEIAERRALEIQTDFSHSGAGASWVPWGEAIGRNSFTDDIAATSIVEGWLASPEHRAVILGDWTHVGVGVSEAGDTNYFVAVFAVIPTATLPPTDVAP